MSAPARIGLLALAVPVPLAAQSNTDLLARPSAFDAAVDAAASWFQKYL